MKRRQPLVVLTGVSHLDPVLKLASYFLRLFFFLPTYFMLCVSEYRH